jgi:hypothetical protein
LVGTGEKVQIDTTGTYRLVISDNLTACVDSSQQSFNFTISPLNAAISTSASLCKNEPIALVGTAIGDSLKFKWATDGIGQLTADTNITTSYNPSSSDMQSLTINLTVSNRCSTITTSRAISLKSIPDASFTVSDKNFAGEQVSFTNTTDTISHKIDSFIWNLGDNIPVRAFHVSEYNVFLVAINSDNCKDTATRVIQILNGQVTFIPNAFSPNISQKAEENGVCKIYGRNISDQDFNWQIFNRWGEVVYSTQTLKDANEIGWNGKFKNNGDDLPLGVYTYTLSLKYIDGKKFEKTGTINLIR